MRFLFLFLSIFILHNNSFAQTTEQATTKNTAAKENALLWKIEGNGLEMPSYLYGTIHMIPAKDYFLTDATKKSFESCEQVTFEINMEDMMNIGAQMSLMMGAFMNNGTTLKDLLTDDEYKIVDAHFSEMGLPLFLMERIKPMFLSVFASGDMDMLGGMGSMSDTTESAIVSYEMEFMEMAKATDKIMGGLETAEYQMSMFDSIPYKAQADMLMAAIQSEGSDEDGQLDQMVEMYKNQDLQAMGAMLSSDEEGIGQFEDILLEGRNRNWIPVMGGQMKEKSTFFAVGAGHLGGEVGVVSLLRQAGYTVKAVDAVKTVNRP